MSSCSKLATTPRLTGMVCLRCEAAWPVADYEEGCLRCAADGHASNLRLTYSAQGEGVNLPFAQAAGLGEGMTPLMDLQELADELGVGRLTAKLEGCNPTGSHKDRMSVQLVARALSCGARRIVAASSRQWRRFPCRLCRACPSAGRNRRDSGRAENHSRHHDRTGRQHRDGRGQLGALDTCGEAGGGGGLRATNYRLPAIGTNPFGIEGYKTLAAELAAPDMPDVVIVPCARGDLLSGLRLGFAELGRGLPVLVAAEPFARLSRVLAGEDYRGAFAGETQQASIAGHTVTYQSVAALRDSHGFAVPVSDAAAAAAQRRLRAHGLDAELSAASALAALAVAAAGGKLAGRHITLVLTAANQRKSINYLAPGTETGGTRQQGRDGTALPERLRMTSKLMEQEREFR